jgi:hypothetical protein
MDISLLVTSVNRISLFFFIITLGFLGYEFYLLKVQRKKSTKPSIPDFKENMNINITAPTVYANKKGRPIKKTNSYVIIGLIILLIFFGLLALWDFSNTTKNKVATISPSLAMRLVSSGGIRVLDNNFVTLSDSDLNKVKKGDTIIIGIEKIKETDVDMARIKVNTLDWKKAEVTDRYDPKHNIYFITYTVATAEAVLNIQAQLHSKVDGWLGE